MVTSNNEKYFSKKHAFTEITESSGRFYLHTHGEPDEITNILDASLSGIRILLESPLAEAQRLILSYLAEDLNLAIEAEVIWSAFDSETGLFQTSIRFNPRQSDLCTLFFLAFRKRLENFDDDSRQLQS